MLAAVEGHHAAVAGVHCRRLPAFCLPLREIYTPGAAAGSLLRSECTALRIILPVLVHGVLEYIVVSCNIGRHQNGRTAAGSYRHLSGRVEPVAIFPHGFRDAAAEVVPLDSPFLIAHAPEYYARVVSVPFDHPLQQTGMLFVDSCETVLLDDQYAQPVAGVQHFRSHRIVA